MSHYVAKASIPIRRPAAEVFHAFVDPAIITKFWLKNASAPLAPGATADWEFMVPGAKDTVTVLEFQLNCRLVWRWSDGTVTVDFGDFEPGGTLVSVATSPFDKDKVDALVETTQGFTIVLCDLKTLLESGSSANLAKDKAAWIARSKGK